MVDRVEDWRQQESRRYLGLRRFPSGRYRVDRSEPIELRRVERASECARLRLRNQLQRDRFLHPGSERPHRLESDESLWWSSHTWLRYRRRQHLALHPGRRAVEVLEAPNPI